MADAFYYEVKKRSQIIGYSTIKIEATSSLDNLLSILLLIIITIKLGTCNQEQDMCIWTSLAFSTSVALVYYGVLQPLLPGTLTNSCFYSETVGPLMPCLVLWSSCSNKFGVRPIKIKIIIMR